MTLRSFIDSFSYSQLHLKWSRNRETGCYTLDFDYPGMGYRPGIETITKLSSGGYIDNKGNTYRLLREAKEGVFAQVKTHLVHLIDQMNQRKKDDPTGQQELTLFEYASLKMILDGMLNQVLADLPSLLDLHNIPCEGIRDKRRRFANALAAFDSAGIMYSFLESRVYHTPSNGMRIVRFERICLAITADRDGRVKSFGSNGWLEFPFPRFNMDGVRQVVDQALDAVAAYRVVKAA